MQCQNCSHELIERSRFCDSCGAPTAHFVHDEDSVKIYCGKCSGRLQGTRRYCMHCGEPSPLVKGSKAKGSLSDLVTKILSDPRAQLAGVLLMVVMLVVPMFWATKEPERAKGNQLSEEALAAMKAMNERDLRFTLRPAIPESAAEELELASFSGAAVDFQGNAYVADPERHCIYRITSRGRRSVFAGTPDEPGFRGDGGSSEQALFYRPSGVAIDNWGNLFVADTGNNAIRVINSQGLTFTVAGKPSRPVGTEAELAPALKVDLPAPTGISLGIHGGLLVSTGGANSMPQTWVMEFETPRDPETGAALPQAQPTE